MWLGAALGRQFILITARLNARMAIRKSAKALTREINFRRPKLHHVAALFGLRVHQQIVELLGRGPRTEDQRLELQPSGVLI